MVGHLAVFPFCPPATGVAMAGSNGKHIQFCPRVKTLVVQARGTRWTRIYPIRCKCWTCNFCARKNLGKLIKQIEANRPERFITLTCKRQMLETPLMCYDRHRGQIRKLFDKVRRKFGPCEYAVFCELHHSGFPHWHILQRGAFIPQRWLSAEWEKMTGSRIVDIRRCGDSREAARYVTKYVTKSIHCHRLDPRFRIVTFSKHFRPPKERNPTWAHCDISFLPWHPYTELEGSYKGREVQWTGECFNIPDPDAAQGAPGDFQVPTDGTKLESILDTGPPVQYAACTG